MMGEMMLMKERTPGTWMMTVCLILVIECRVLTWFYLHEFIRFQTTTRVTAAKHSEGNRRIGGIKTQTSTIKIWNVSIDSVFLAV